MTELIKSFFEASRDRLKSPFLGTYTLSFLLFNWRAILFLIFSDAQIEDKIIVINHEYSSWQAILWPFFVTLIIIFCLPYLMVVIDLSLVKPTKSRKSVRHNEEIAELDRKIIVASKEFEIQSQKTGTKTIESLQGQIEILEKEKKALTEISTSERENNLIELNRINDALKIERDKNISLDFNMIQYPITVFEIYNYLHNSDKLEEFYNYFDSFTEKLYLDQETIKYYEDLGLAKTNGPFYTYTNLAYELYAFMFELWNSKEEKKKITTTAEKLNKHEYEIFRELEYEKFENFTFSESFRKSIINDLLIADFVKLGSNNKYKLSEIGVALRNFIGLNER